MNSAPSRLRFSALGRSSSLLALGASSAAVFGRGGGSSSSSEPVSLHFSIAAPWADSSNTVTDAGDTTMRWKWSRCTPGVVRDRGLDRVGVRHDDHHLARVVGDDRFERGDHAGLHLGQRLAARETAPATARAAPSSTGLSWPGRRACRRSTRRSRPRCTPGSGCTASPWCAATASAVCVVRSIGLA